MFPVTISGKFGRLPAMAYVEYNYEGGYMIYSTYVTGYDKYANVSGSGRTLYHALENLSGKVTEIYLE